MRLIAFSPCARVRAVNLGRACQIGTIDRPGRIIGVTQSLSGSRQAYVEYVDGDGKHRETWFAFYQIDVED